MFSLAHSLANGVVCQRRTGNNKQFVILDGSRVIKGPYLEARLESLMLKARYLAMWGSLAIIPIEVLDTAEGKFVVFPNLATDYPVEVEKERNQESFSKYPPYQVLVRSGLVKGNHALEQGNRAILDQAYPLLMTYLYLFLLGAGDVHFVNTLVDLSKNKVYVIDYDEERGKKEEDDELFYLSINPAKKYREEWLSIVRQFYGPVLEKLNELDKKYFNSEMMARLEVVNKNLVAPIGSIKPITIPGAKGLMKYSGGMKGSLSYSGKAIDVLISGVQKYIRRGMLEKALLCGFELARMPEMEPDAKRIVTNLHNRLEVIAAEDLLNPSLLLAILKNTDRTPGMLYTIIELLVNSPKTRIMSWAWRAYCTPEGRNYFVNHEGKLDTATTEADITHLIGLKSIYWRNQDDLKVLGNRWMYLELFLDRLKKQDLNCFAWLHYFMEATKDKSISKRQSHGLGKGKRDSPMIYVWEMLGITCGPSPGHLIPGEMADWLAKSYFEASDFNKKPFLSVAVMIAFYRIRDQAVILVGKGEELYRKYLLGQYGNWEIDGFVVDKHTSEGKKMGKDRKDFAMEGSVVANQDPRYYNELLYQAYRNS